MYKSIRQLAPVLRLAALGLLFALHLPAAHAAPGGSLPLRVVTAEVEQVASAPRPLMRREVADRARLQAAIVAQERHTDALLRQAGARGTAVGWDEEGQPVIKVYVSAAESSAGVPTRLDGFPVQVEQTGRLFALNVACAERGDCPQPGLGSSGLTASAGEPGPTEYHPRPVPIGVSAGHQDVTAGTLACRVSQGCHPYALSNAHVFADENTGQPGDTILQPAAFDGGANPADSIGTLYDSIPIVMSEFAFNKVDAAIAAVDLEDVGNATPAEGYGTPRNDIITPSVLLNVMKYGRTTRLTYGYIDALNATVLVTYDAGDARFVGQIIIKEENGGDFSRPGDSGSLVVASGGTAARRPVGLLFASGTGISVANPISDVLTELAIDIDGE